MKRLIILGLVAGLLGTAFLAGFFVSDQGVFPASQIVRVKNKVASLLAPEEPEPAAPPTIATHALNLQVQRLAVPHSRRGRGGGLTSAGASLLVLSHEGRIFVQQEGALVETDIATPSNGYQAYAEAAERDFPDLSHDILKFRYNDVLYRPGRRSADLFVSYTHWWADRECYTNTVSRLRLPGGRSPATASATAGDWEQLYATEPCLPLKSVGRALEGHMAGGRLALTDEGTVLLGSGDYHWDGVRGPEAIAQQPDHAYGKIIEIDPDSGAHRTYSVGHRNLSGVAVATGGQVWAVEHGPRGGDELNRVDADGNYGWPEATLGTQYNGLAWPLGGRWARHRKHEMPAFAWVPSVGISSLTQVSGFHPAWDGDLLVGSLKQQTLFRLRLDEGRPVFVEPIRIGNRIRDVHQHDDDTIALLTDSKEVLLLTRDESPMVWNVIDDEVARLGNSPERRRRLRAGIEQCAQCHSFEPGQHDGAPSLVSVMGAEIASTPYPGYSQGLASLSGVWNEKRLAQYLTDPQAFAAGTTMPNPALREQTIADIIEVLNTLNGG